MGQSSLLHANFRSFLITFTNIIQKLTKKGQASIDYNPISDVFDNIEYFLCIIEMIQL